MDTKKKRRGKPRCIPALVALTPGAVSDQAYAFYVFEKSQTNGHDEKSRGAQNPNVELARRSVANYKALSKMVEKGSSDWVFLTSVDRIVVSLSRGIARRKQTFHERQEEARERKEEQKRIISNSVKQSAVFQLSIRSLLLGAVGFLLSEFILPMIKHGDLSHQSLMSIATGLGIALASDYFKRWIVQIRLLNIDARHAYSVNFALKEYRNSSSEEYERARQEASHAWKRYTGSTPPKTMDYGHVVQEEIMMCEEGEAEQKRLMAWYKTLQLLSGFANYVPGIRKRKSKTPTEKPTPIE